MTGYGIRYRPDTDLGRRFPTPSHLTLPTREAAEDLRRACVNAEHMEVIELPEVRQLGDPPGPDAPRPNVRRHCDPAPDDDPPVVRRLGDPPDDLDSEDDDQ